MLFKFITYKSTKTKAKIIKNEIMHKRTFLYFTKLPLTRGKGQRDVLPKAFPIILNYQFPNSIYPNIQINKS